MTHPFRAIIGLLCGLTLTAPYSVSAGSFDGQTLRVQQWPTGPETEALKKYVIDPLMKETGANIEVEYGHTSASVAKARAQKDDPQLDVILMDEIGVYTLAREGILEKLDLTRMPNAKDVYPNYVIADGTGIGIDTYVVSILYNTKTMAAAPTSWGDLWDPQYKGKIILPPANVARAPLIALIAAQLSGGGIDNMDPAWSKLQQLRPNLHSFLENRALSAEAFRSGEAAMTVDFVAYWKGLIAAGVPVAMADNLKEGFFNFAGAAAIMKGSKGNRDLAYTFINKLLSIEAQQGMAEDNGFGPTNRNVKVSAQAAKYMVASPDQVAHIIPLDGLKLLQLNPQIVDQWNKIFAR